MLKYAIIIILCFTLACKGKHSQDIVGHWTMDQNWYHFETDSTYNTGIGDMTFFRDFKCNFNEEQNELTLFTDKEKDTYYFTYNFRSTDTLELHNKINPNGATIIWVRQHTNE